MAENPLNSENTASLVARTKGIILRPTEEWPKIAAESKSPMEVLTSYALPLAALGPICTLIGSQIFGYGAFGFSYKPSITSAATMAVVSFIMSIVGIYLVSFIANFLAPKFDGKENFNSAFKLVAYSMTASMLAGVFGLVPALGILAIVGLYSFYLFYKGVGDTMGVPENKAVSYTVVTVVCAVVLQFVLGAIVASTVGASALSMAAAAASG